MFVATSEIVKKQTAYTESAVRALLTELLLIWV